MATIAIFASSLFLASILVLTKAIEIRLNKKSFVLRLLAKLDERATSTALRIKFLSLLLIQSARYMVLVKTPELFKEWVGETKNKVLVAYRERESVIMGKRNITNKGSVSFFLKKIDENRESGRGKIEESL